MQFPALCLAADLPGSVESPAADAANINGAPRSLSFQVHDPVLASERRLALVIGNSNYKDSPLANPSNDARAVAAKLRQLGFEVMEKENANRNELVQLSREFGNKLKLGGVGVFYYAGHGVQVNGINYLLPIDTDIQDETEVQSRTYDLNEMLSKMDAAQNRLNIIILDACRNNPLVRTTRSFQRGLAAMQQGKGTILAYATAPDKTAADGPTGGNSLYTEQLLLALSQPGLRVEDVFKQVRIEVLRRSDGTQTPWENSSLTGEFYFNRGGAQMAPSEVAAPLQMASVTERQLQTVTSRNIQASPALLPRTLLENYQLSSNLSMPAPMALGQFAVSDSRFAMVTQDRQLRVWDIVTSNTLLSHDGFDTPSISSDGRYIVGVADDHTVNLLDLSATPLAIRKFPIADAQHAVVEVSLKRLLIVGRSGAVTFYDLDSGKALVANAVKIVGEPRIELAPGGARALVLGGPKSDGFLLNVENGKKLSRISEQNVREARFSKDGSLMLISSDGGAATIYRTADGASVSKLALGGNNATLSKTEFIGNEELIGYVLRTDAKAGVLHRLAVWNIKSGKLVSSLTEGAAVTDLRYPPGDSQRIYFSLADNTINVYELNTKTKRKLLTDAKLDGFSIDGQRILVREGDGTRLYDARTFTPVARMPGQTNAFIQANAGGVFATTSSDGKLSLWEFERGDPVSQLKGHIDEVEKIVFAPGGKRLVSFGKARTAKLWGLPEVQNLDKLKRDEFESTSDYRRRVSEWSSPYTALVSLVEYDADAEAYTVRIGDVTMTLPTPPAEAKRFSGQREGVLTGKLKVYDGKQLELSDAKLSRLP